MPGHGSKLIAIMATHTPHLAWLVDQLTAEYGPQAMPAASGPWELVLWENVAYLADDERRTRAFRTLKERVGTEPVRILDAEPEDLLAATRHGIMPEQRVGRLRDCAHIMMDLCDGDPDRFAAMPVADLRRALKRFPGIGDPGADKILLLCRRRPVLALESNGLRVMLRLGYGKDDADYARAYRSVQHAIAEPLQDVVEAVDGDKSAEPDSAAACHWLIQTHLLLRTHGQVRCRRAAPECDACPLAVACGCATRESQRAG